MGKWHFVGIGGVGMSGIAKAWLELGNQVSGSDLEASPLTKRLEAMGAQISIGRHSPANVTKGLEAVVVSSAIKQDNPELVQARAYGIPIIRRGACLAKLMTYKTGIAVAGAHGKTTTSSMIAYLLDRGGLEPAFFIGAYVADLGANGRWDSGRYLVAESDESDGSFLELSPGIAVVTNIEDDHLDYYGSTDKINEAFVRFIDKVPSDGVAVICQDDQGIRAIMPRISHDRLLTYGAGSDADLRCDEPVHEDGAVKATLYWRQAEIGVLRLRIPGRHNILNAMGAMVVGKLCGLEYDDMIRTLAGFGGAKRRMELVGQAGGVSIYDDYAHHPTEIRATLDAACTIAATRRIVAFQPHRYTRTKLLADRFAMDYKGADELILLPVYAAGEDPIEGVDTALIAGRIASKRDRPPYLAKNLDDACDIACGLLSPGDMFITMGAGDVYKLGRLLQERLLAEA